MKKVQSAATSNIEAEPERSVKLTLPSFDAEATQSAATMVNPACGITSDAATPNNDKNSNQEVNPACGLSSVDSVVSKENSGSVKAKKR